MHHAPDTASFDSFGAFAEPAPKRRRVRLVAIGVVAAVVLAGAAVAGADSDPGARYRTTEVATRAVDEVLHAVATVEPVSQASVAFPVAGTVASVKVAVGDTVAVGDPLASLDTAALEATLTERQAALAQAELVLEKALDGESAGSTGTNGDAQTIALSTPAPTGGSATDAQLSALQQAVLDAQRQVDVDLLAAQQVLANATRICGGDEDEATDATTTTTTTGTPTSTDDLAACRTALGSVMAAQQQVATSQSALAQASTALDALLAQRAAASGAVTDDDGSQAPSQNTPSNPSAPSGSNGGDGASASSSPSAADLVAYQKAVDAAALQVMVAAQAIEQATIASPIAGTVAVVGLAVGDDVAAGSTTADIVVVGAGGYEVTTTVSVTDLPDVEVGQAVTISPDGSDAIIDGQVVSIGVAGRTSSGTTTYPVVIGIVGDGTDLRNGSVASVGIVTNATSAALAVPTSAITTQGSRHTVRVLDGGAVTTKTVEVGALGATWTEITSGLTAGDVVALADMNEPLPGSATENSGSTNQNQFGVPGGRIEFRGPPPN
jgi:multidrug efflux pump subunit AcrA (membrane-fusion protein)